MRKAPVQEVSRKALGSARPGTRCHELRERLRGTLSPEQFLSCFAGRGEVTFLAPVNDAIEKAARARLLSVSMSVSDLSEYIYSNDRCDQCRFDPSAQVKRTSVELFCKLPQA